MELTVERACLEFAKALESIPQIIGEAVPPAPKTATAFAQAVFLCLTSF